MKIAVASQKGGVGKTTTSLSLASYLARQGKKVLLVDTDSQANASKVLIPEYLKLKRDETVCATILDRKPLVVYETETPNLDLVPSHILLSNADTELTIAKDHRESRLKTELDKIADRYDFIFLDCPPSLGWLTINAFTAVDKILVVVSPGYFELDSVVQLSKTLAECREYYNPTLDLLGMLFVMADPTVNSRESLKILRQTYSGSVFNTIIPRNTDLRDAHFQKKDIFAYNPNSKGALSYKRLAEEIWPKK